MSNELASKKVGGASAADIATQSGASTSAVPGKSTLTSGLADAPAVDDRNDPAKRPPEYAGMDQAIVDLLWRSKDECFKDEKKVPITGPFWDRVDKAFGVKHLHTLAQIIPGARALGVLPSIVTLTDVANYGSSWGIHFKGPSVLPIATNGQWGRDWPQSAVRAKHYNTAHDWYRQDSGAGNPGMHMGVDAGAGDNNIHWDPTNPMESVSKGQTGSPLLAKMPGFNEVIPKGDAIYSPSSLLGHLADIGETKKVPVIGGWLTDKLKTDHKGTSPNASTEPFYSISETIELTHHSRYWSQLETECKAHWVDKTRAAAAIARLDAASAALEQLRTDAKPLAVQEQKPENEAGRAALGKRLEEGTKEMFEALASFVRHLHAEAPNAAAFAGYDNASDWQLPIWPRYDLVVGLQKERASHYLPKL
ncbi:MAG: hypothetical protein H0T89_03410 [Deltaproteobacteria bacterium]|nr:hypothetical protein [Deltaproteobacteria bacterium]